MSMVVLICDSQGRQVARLTVDEGRLEIEGQLPGGLTASDLSSLGFVYYETDQRNECVARVKEVPLSNCLDYLRALNDALPPGYHVAQVESASIEQERLEKRLRFEAELTLMDADD